MKIFKKDRLLQLYCPTTTPKWDCARGRDINEKETHIIIYAYYYLLNAYYIIVTYLLHTYHTHLLLIVTAI